MMIAVGRPGLVEPRGGNYHFDYVLEDLFMSTGFLVESD